MVTGAGDLAPGLVAGRAQSAPLAAADCAPPVPDQWFTAVGADATHDSVLELVNPNAGRAIADITVRSPGGVLDVPGLLGVSVPGNSSTELDLGQIVPKPGRALARGAHQPRPARRARRRLLRRAGRPVRPASDWLPAQAEPATANLLLGLTQGAGERTLVLSNPGADEVRATVKVVTPTSTFAPTGVEPIRVAPDSTESVSLDDVLAQAAKDGAIGLLVESNGPVTATLRQVDRRRPLAAHRRRRPSPRPTAVVVPAGPKHLLLGGADAAGGATVTSYSARGKQLDQQQVELGPDAGADLTLPDAAVLVTVTPDGHLGAGRGAAQRHRHRRRTAPRAGADRPGARRATRRALDVGSALEHVTRVQLRLVHALEQQADVVADGRGVEHLAEHLDARRPRSSWPRHRRGPR